MTTFGIEIEILTTSTRTGVHLDQTIIANAIASTGVPCVAEHYNHMTRNHWKVVPDGSCGYEVVSPILDPRNGDGCYEDIIKVCNALRQLGCQVDRRCGLHVHLGIGHMSPKNLAAFCGKYIRNEHFIDNVMPASRRASVNQYCRSNASLHGQLPNFRTQGQAYCDQVNRKLVQLRGVRTLAQLSHVLHDELNGSRYSKLNFTSRPMQQGTIEVRHGAGTTNAAKICMWVRFLQSMLRDAERSTYFRNVTNTNLNATLAWGIFWRMDDPPAARWFMSRFRKFIRLSGEHVDPNAPSRTARVQTVAAA